MRIFDILNEAPLPDTWDKQVFTPQTSYAAKIKYAVERAQKLGKGSSRTVFEIEHEGRPTVLKVAHNAKGMAQNEAEANILDDNYIQQTGIVIPLIDYDTEHDQPVWVHVEKAQKATKKQLCTIMQCGELYWLVDTAIQAYSQKGHDYSKEVMALYNTTNREDIDTFFQYVDQMQLLMSIGVNIHDFTTPQNWGLYQGEPVVIDLGFTNDVQSKYYSR